MTKKKQPKKIKEVSKPVKTAPKKKEVKKVEPEKINISKPIELKQNKINGVQQMERITKALPKDVPEPTKALKYCDACHLQFEEDALAICHVPGKMAGRICGNCRNTKHYHIVDPNHPEFMI